MHSLKNTVIAVGLLGLSFVFYQLSSSKPTDLDLTAPLTMLPEGESVADDASDDIFIEPLPEGLTAPINPAPPAMDSPPSTGSAPPLRSFDAPPAQSPGMERIQQARNSTPDREPLQPPSTIGSGDSPENRDRGLIGALATVPGLSPTSPPQTEHPPFQPADGETPVHSTSPEGHVSKNPVAPLITPLPKATYPEVPSGPGANGFDPGVVQASKTFPDLDLASIEYQDLWPSVNQLVKAQQLREALQLLSRFYHSPEMTEPERKRLVDWLDALAAKVIFSEEHHLADGPYSVTPMESLADIAQQWKVPGQVIYNINQSSIPNPAFLQPGTQLKMIPGPFRAEIDRQRSTMTLFLGDLYAVQFPVRIGISGQVRPGEFGVMEKSESGFNWQDATGKIYGPSEPENGYGPYWIGIEGMLCIHAIDDDKEAGHNGCIGLSKVDAKDVFGMLSAQSKVTIR